MTSKDPITTVQVPKSLAAYITELAKIEAPKRQVIRISRPDMIRIMAEFWADKRGNK